MSARKEAESAPRILLVDDHAVFRHGLKSILEVELKGAIFAEAADAESALALFQQGTWDVAVLDITMPGRSGLELIRDLKRFDTEARVLVLSMHPEEHYALRALRAGASGYITKAKAGREIVQAVKEVLAGKAYLSPTASRKVLAHLSGGSGHAAHDALSGRELEIMRLMASGKSGKQVAAELGISIQTVSTHRSNILKKMGFQSGAQIVRYAIENHLVE